MDKELKEILDDIGETIDYVTAGVAKVKEVVNGTKRLELGEFGNQTIMQLLQVKQMAQNGVISGVEAERVSSILIENFCVSGYQSGALSKQGVDEWRSRLEKISEEHCEDAPEK